MAAVKVGMAKPLTRTTLRLPSELHRRLKLAAAEESTTSESILVEAVRRELQRRSGAQVRTIELPDSMNTQLAEIVLQSMPTLVIIKDQHGRIEWANTFAEQSLEMSLDQIIGWKITELGLTDGIQKEVIVENIERVISEQISDIFKEGMHLKGLGPVTIRAQRFPLPPMKVGDISFVEHEIRDMSYAPPPDVLRRLQHTPPHPMAEELFQPFVEKAPIAMALKKPLEADSQIVWANQVYLNLVNKKPDEAFGRRTTEVLGVTRDHAIIAREAEVVRTGRARMSKEKFQDHERWSLRFPIHDHSGAVALVGVVSPDFRKTDASPSGQRAASTTLTDRGG